MLNFSSGGRPVVGMRDMYKADRLSHMLLAWSMRKDSVTVNARAGVYPYFHHLILHDHTTTQNIQLSGPSAAFRVILVSKRIVVLEQGVKTTHPMVFFLQLHAYAVGATHYAGYTANPLARVCLDVLT